MKLRTDGAPGTCKKQIPCGDDNKKGNSNSKGNGNRRQQERQGREAKTSRATTRDTTTLPRPSRGEGGAPGCRGWGTRARKKQISCGDDNKKGNSNSKGNRNRRFPSGMTTREATTKSKYLARYHARYHHPAATKSRRGWGTRQSRVGHPA